MPFASLLLSEDLKPSKLGGEEVAIDTRGPLLEWNYAPLASRESSSFNPGPNEFQTQ